MHITSELRIQISSKSKHKFLAQSHLSLKTVIMFRDHKDKLIGLTLRAEITIVGYCRKNCWDIEKKQLIS